MEDEKITPWELVWFGLAVAGIVGIILGHPHHLITVIFGTAMLMITRKRKDNN